VSMGHTISTPLNKVISDTHRTRFSQVLVLLVLQRVVKIPTFSEKLFKRCDYLNALPYVVIIILIRYYGFCSVS